MNGRYCSPKFIVLINFTIHYVPLQVQTLFLVSSLTQMLFVITYPQSRNPGHTKRISLPSVPLQHRWRLTLHIPVWSRSLLVHVSYGVKLSIESYIIYYLSSVIHRVSLIAWAFCTALCKLQAQASNQVNPCLRS